MAASLVSLYQSVKRALAVSNLIRVLLVEDDEVFRIGLTVSLRQCLNVELVGTASDGQTAITLANALEPELILMDIGLPVFNGIEATKIIKNKHKSIKILALTSHSEPKILDEMMDAGADGYCMKGISTDRLCSLIQEVSKGAFWVDAAVAEQIKRHLKGISGSQLPQSFSIPLAGLETLTEREREVLALIAEGKKNQQIADQLFISPGTVRVHVHSILNKLNVKDRTQAALFLVQKNKS